MIAQRHLETPRLSGGRNRWSVVFASEAKCRSYCPRGCVAAQSSPPPSAADVLLKAAVLLQGPNRYQQQDLDLGSPFGSTGLDQGTAASGKRSAGPPMPQGVHNHLDRQGAPEVNLAISKQRVATDRLRPSDGLLLQLPRWSRCSGLTAGVFVFLLSSRTQTQALFNRNQGAVWLAGLTTSLFWSRANMVQRAQRARHLLYRLPGTRTHHLSRLQVQMQVH